MQVADQFLHLAGDNRPYAEVSLMQYRGKAMIDSGANATILGYRGWELIKNKKNILKPSSDLLSTADGLRHRVKGRIDLPITVSGITRVVEVVVCTGIPTWLILGIDFCKIFGITADFAGDEFKVNSTVIRTLNEESPRLTEGQKKRLDAIIGKFKQIHRDQPARTHLVSHHIDTGDARPIKQRYLPLSPAMQVHMDSEIDQMLNAGIIRESNSPWASPALLVKKSDGSYRFCFDGRKLNGVTKKDAYPLPYISSILDRLKNAKYISSIDLRKAFWQIPLTKESCEKTAFTVPRRGLFEFLVMPFGIANAPATQQRLMDRLFGPLLGDKLFVYLDDIIIVSETFEEHEKMLLDVHQKLSGANLTINLDKCEFCRTSLSYLGYVVDQNGLRTDPSKVIAIAEFPQPKTATEVKRFLGMCSWYRRFVPDFATKSAALTELIKSRKKRQSIQWNTEAEKSFKALKKALSTTPILDTPDFKKPFVVQCDASDVGLGAVLTQGEGDEEKVICYASRTLIKAERNYSVTERECLALIFGIEKFRPYIEGTVFTVQTDHHSLLWLMNMKDPTGRLARWAVKLSQYSFNIIHRQGKQNVVPDALSRAPLESSFLQLEPADRDAWYNSLMEKVSCKPESYPDWRVEDGSLLKMVPNGHGVRSNLVEWKQVVPKSRRRELLRQYHDDPTSAHLGTLKTLRKIQELYYWPKMKQEVGQYVRRCQVCLASKTSQLGRAGLMGQPKKVRYPFQCISVDLMGPFPRSPKGNTGLIVVCDWVTKFVLVKPVSKATARAIVQYLENDVFLLFGVPQILMTDNGAQFQSSLFKNLMNQYEVQTWYNASYHPQVNFVERTNRVIGTAIRSYVQDNHRSWDAEIHKVAHAIRTSVHDVTGYTPSLLNLGRTVPSNGTYYGKLPGPDEEPLALDDREKLVLDIHQNEPVYQQVRDRMKKAYRQASSRYNLRKRQVQFRVGDLVWKRNYVLSDASKGFVGKLAPKYVKCVVKEVTGPLTYRLVDDHGRPCGVFHIKDLKADPLTESDPPQSDIIP